jgi:N-acetylglutamate synthase-like GNAT family acetyltransferase
MGSYRVRRYRPTDAAAVWDVHVRDLSEVLPLFSHDWATDLHDVEREYLPRGDFLVVEAGGEVVATGAFLPEDEATVSVCRVRIDPDWRESAVGRDLFAALERLARLRGFERAILDTTEHLTETNRVVEAVDYELVGRDPLPEWDVDVLYYQKAL